MHVFLHYLLKFTFYYLFFYIYTELQLLFLYLSMDTSRENGWMDNFLVSFFFSTPIINLYYKYKLKQKNYKNKIKINLKLMIYKTCN